MRRLKRREIILDVAGRCDIKARESDFIVAFRSSQDVTLTQGTTHRCTL